MIQPSGIAYYLRKIFIFFVIILHVTQSIATTPNGAPSTGAGSIAGSYSGAGSGMAGAAASAGTAVGGAAASAGTAAGGAAASAGTAVGGAAASAGTAVGGAAASAGTAVGGAAETAIGAAPGIAAAAPGVAAGAAASAIGAAPGIAGAASGAVGGAAGVAAGAVGDAAATASGAVSGAAGAASGAVGTAIGAAPGIAAAAPGVASGAVGTAIGAAPGIAQGALGAAPGIAQGALGAAQGAAQGAAGTALGAGASVGGAALSGATETASGAYNSAAAATTDIANWAASSASAPPSGYNPCNQIYYIFGTYTFPDHRETWNGVNFSRRESPLCPPWNKTARSGCLKQFGLPSEYDMAYNRYCAEKSDRNDFFSPRIKVRVQTCNVACWTMSKTLDGDGECGVFPGPFGIPTTRLCARIAMPAEPALKASSISTHHEGVWPVSQNPPPAEEPGTPASHGYVYAWHLGREGEPVGDPIYPGDDGDLVYHARPKVCAYWDPSFWDALANYGTFMANAALGAAVTLTATAVGASNSGVVTQPQVDEFIRAAGVDPSSAHLETASLSDSLQVNFQPDLWDLNPMHQAIHYHEGGVFIVFQMLIQLVKMGVQMGEMINGLMNSLPEGLKNDLIIIEGIIYLLSTLTIIGKDIMIPVLEALGQFNSVVTASLGCAMIPLGPYPPPYCDTLVLPDPAPLLNRICHTTVNGTEVPDGVNKCINSDVENNAVRNSVRVSFREMMPLCDRDQSPSDMCVEIHPTRDPQALYTMTSNKSILNICNATKSNLPCAESSRLTEKCAQDTDWCSQGIRIEYALRSNNEGAVVPKLRDFYNTTIPNCNVLSEAPVCQAVWGVNIGYWRDISLLFPDEENGFNRSELISTTQTLTAPSGMPVSFKLLIPRIAKTLPNGGELDPDRIYLYNDDLDRILDSAARAEAPKPTVYNCGTQGVNCTSHHIRPGIVVKVQVNSDSTKGALSTDTAIDPRPLNTLPNTQINLAGRTFGSFVTDDNYTIMPFEGANAMTPNTLMGNYKNGVPTYSPTGSITPTNLIHTGGLDYYLGRYALGGSKICLTGYDFDDCFTSQSKLHCVLARLSNSDQVRCTDFVNMLAPRYPGLGLCTEDQANRYSLIENVDVPKPTSGTLQISVKGDNPNGPFCYDYADRDRLGKLCAASQKIEDRIVPDPIFGDVLAETNCTVVPPAQPPCNYDFDPSSPPNPNSLAVRNKNAIEHDMCVDVPDGPECAAITENGASWPASNPIQEVTGTCSSGWLPIGSDSLKRYCTINRNTGQSMWEPINSTTGCKEICRLVTTSAYTSYNSSDKSITFVTPNRMSSREENHRISFEITNISQVNSFMIKNMHADDEIQITVNGNIVASAPNPYVGGSRELGNTAYGPNNVNIINHLRVGWNDIDIRYSIGGKGEAYSQIELDIQGCSDMGIVNSR